MRGLLYRLFVASRWVGVWVVAGVRLGRVDGLLPLSGSAGARECPLYEARCSRPGRSQRAAAGVAAVPFLRRALRRARAAAERGVVRSGGGGPGGAAGGAGRRKGAVSGHVPRRVGRSRFGCCGDAGSACCCTWGAGARAGRAAAEDGRAGEGVEVVVATPGRGRRSTGLRACASAVGRLRLLPADLAS